MLGEEKFILMGFSGHQHAYATTKNSKAGIVTARLPFGLLVALFRFPSRINQVLPLVARETAALGR